MDTLLVLVTVLVLLKLFEVVTLYVVLFHYAVKKIDKEMEEAVKGD